MKKYAIAAFLAILVAVMIAFPPTGEPAQKNQRAGNGIPRRYLIKYLH